MHWWRDLTWFTLDWGKRWGLPIAVLAIGAGALAGATQWRFGGGYEALSARQTVTEKAEPVTYTKTADPVVETVVREKAVEGPTRTVTLTPPPVPPVTVVRTVESRSEPGTADPETVTETVTVTPDVQAVMEAVARGRGGGR